MKTLFTTVAAFVASTGFAFANANGCTGGAFGGQTCTAVPEISALEGTAAIAALAAIVLLAWERRRRAA